MIPALMAPFPHHVLCMGITPQVFHFKMIVEVEGVEVGCPLISDDGIQGRVCGGCLICFSSLHLHPSLIDKQPTLWTFSQGQNRWATFHAHRSRTFADQARSY